MQEKQPKSLLRIVPVEELQKEINKAAKANEGRTGIYLSLNKTYAGSEKALIEAGIKTDSLFFIDCVTSDKKKEEVLHIAPDNLALLEAGITAFIREIKGEKFLLIDSLGTLLIYNHENEVAKFVKKMAEITAKENVFIIAFSPATQGKELLAKVYNFFDKVEKVGEAKEMRLEAENEI